LNFCVAMTAAVPPANPPSTGTIVLPALSAKAPPEALRVCSRVV
jgi:hypothetical protein